MEKDTFKTILKCAIFGVIWAVILLGVATLIVNSTNYLLKDVLFIEGILFVILGVLASFSGNSMGLSMQGLGQSSAQYVANSTLEANKKDSENNIKVAIRFGLSTLSLILGGALVIVINFII